MKIVANVDWYARDLDLDVKDLLWPLSLYQHGGNILAALSGAVSSTWSQQQYSMVPSGLSQGGTRGAISGALSGAGIGAMVGGPWGGVAGAALGGVAGYNS